MDNVNITELKKIIRLAEKKLEDLENSPKDRKKKIIREELENAYKLLNSDNYTQEEVDKESNILWKKLQDKGVPLFILFFMFFLLICSVIFLVYEAYSFNHGKKPEEHPGPPEVNDVVKINYVNKQIISLTEQEPLSDEEGLKNPPQIFEIYNNTYENKGNYLINYEINITEMTSDSDSKLSKEFIKYQLVRVDEQGREERSKIGTFNELIPLGNNKYKLTEGSQTKNKKYTYKLIVWISAFADNSQANKKYVFSFDVNAYIKAV